jgi:hypothetical protein
MDFVKENANDYANYKANDLIRQGRGKNANAHKCP